MNRKRNCVVLTVLFIAVAVLFAAGSAMAKDEPIVFKLSQPTPPTGFYGEGYAYFAKAVEEETGGQVKVQVYPSASLISDPEAFDAVRKGIVDIAHFASVTVSPKAKEMTPFDVPSAYKGERLDALNTATRPLLEKIFAKYKIKFVGPGYPETLAFAAIKKVTVKSPEDLKGKSVRASGRWAGEAVKMWGGSPVAIALGDLPAALQRGAVDVVLTSWIVIDAFKLYEAAPNVTFTGIQNILTGLMMSEKAWKSMDAAQQQAFMRAEKRWRDYLDEKYKNLKTQFEQRIIASGGTFYDLTDEQNQAFKSIRQPLLDQVKSVAKADGQALIEAFDNIK